MAGDPELHFQQIDILSFISYIYCNTETRNHTKYEVFCFNNCISTTAETAWRRQCTIHCTEHGVGVRRRNCHGSNFRIWFGFPCLNSLKRRASELSTHAPWSVYGVRHGVGVGRWATRHAATCEPNSCWQLWKLCDRGWSLVCLWTVCNT